MNGKKRFLALVSEDLSDAIHQNVERIERRAMLRESQKIAMAVLERLQEWNWTQRRLAEALGVSPQQVSKIVGGQQNLTLETMVQLQEVLNIPILATFRPKIDVDFPEAHHSKTAEQIP